MPPARSSTFTLTPTASGTRLSLVQSGFKPGQKKNFNGARYGWKLMGGKLVNLLQIQGGSDAHQVGDPVR
jgi:activator of Hsp90 ATPase-like protein